MRFDVKYLISHRSACRQAGSGLWEMRYCTSVISHILRGKQGDKWIEKGVKTISAGTNSTKGNFGKGTMYTEKVLKQFKNPKNLGKIKNPDGVGKVGNIICGDVMRLCIKIGENNRGEEIIENIGFETLGCVAAIATSSIITEIAKGKTIEQALDLDKKEIIEQLGGLPPVKLHCSILAIDALNEAIYNYLLKNKKEIPKGLAARHKRIEKERGIIQEKFGEWEQ